MWQLDILSCKTVSQGQPSSTAGGGFLWLHLLRQVIADGGVGGAMEKNYAQMHEMYTQNEHEVRGPITRDECLVLKKPENGGNEKVELPRIHAHFEYAGKSKFIVRY